MIETQQQAEQHAKKMLGQSFEKASVVSVDKDGNVYADHIEPVNGSFTVKGQSPKKQKTDVAE